MKIFDTISYTLLVIGVVLILIGGITTAIGKAKDSQTATTAQILTKTTPAGKTTATGYSMILSGGAIVIVAALMNKEIREGLADMAR